MRCAEGSLTLAAGQGGAPTWGQLINSVREQAAQAEVATGRGHSHRLQARREWPTARPRGNTCNMATKSHGCSPGQHTDKGCDQQAKGGVEGPHDEALHAQLQQQMTESQVNTMMRTEHSDQQEVS